MLIRQSVEADFTAMLAIINDAARAYQGVIPADRWHEPYMSANELEREIAAGVVFWLVEQAGRLQVWRDSFSKRASDPNPVPAKHRHRSRLFSAAGGR